MQTKDAEDDQKHTKVRACARALRRKGLLRPRRGTLRRGEVGPATWPTGSEAVPATLLARGGGPRSDTSIDHSSRSHLSLWIWPQATWTWKPRGLHCTEPWYGWDRSNRRDSKAEPRGQALLDSSAGQSPACGLLKSLHYVFIWF